MQVSRTELTVNPAKGITIAPLRFRAMPSPIGARPILAGKANCPVWVALRKLNQGDPKRELYGLGGATVAKPIFCTKKKEKRKW